MKTTVKQLAAGTLVALLLLVGNVNAEGTETKAISRETESTLQLEKWMTDEVLWNTNSVTISEINQETEENMEVECWMTCDKIWNTINNVEETETELTVENWMINDKVWE